MAKKILWGLATLCGVGVVLLAGAGVAKIEQGMAKVEEGYLQEVLDLSELPEESQEVYSRVDVSSRSEELENLACQQARAEYEQEQEFVIEDVPMYIEDVPMYIEDVPIHEETVEVEDDIELILQVEEAGTSQVEEIAPEPEPEPEPTPTPTPAPTSTPAASETDNNNNIMDQFIENGGIWSPEGLTSITTVSYEYDAVGNQYRITRTEWYDANGNCVSVTSSLEAL